MEGIRARGQYLLESDELSDCKFLVGESTRVELVTAHKLYLASSSPVFKIMFYGSMPEGNEPIVVPEIRAEIFKAMLKYIYTNRLALGTFEEACDLHYCAKKYMLPALAAKCVEYIKLHVSFERLFTVYAIAQLYEESELLDECLKLMRSETTKILNHSSWKDAAKSMVSLLFEQETLAINSEIDLYEALLRWSKAECAKKSLPIDRESLRSVSGDLITKIRFLTLTPEQFSSGPGDAEILNKDEAFAIIMNILSTSSNMPEGFTDEKKPRNMIDDEQINGAIEKTNNLFQSTQEGDIYCCRPRFPSTIDSQFTKNSEFRLGFNVDRKITIHGVILPPKTIYWFAGVVPEKKYYLEHLHVSLSPVDGKIIGSTTFQAVTLCGSEIEIKFDLPIVVEKDKDYRINVVFKSGGNYCLARNWPESTICEQVKFTFPPLWHFRRCLIRGILFSK